MSLRQLSLLAALAAALPAHASAAARPDHVLDEVSAPMDVAIDGPVVAYTRRVGTRGVEVVVHDAERRGDRRVVRLAAGRGFSPVDVGLEGRGRRVVVYQRCGGRCDLVAWSTGAQRSRVIARHVTKATDLAIGGGRVFVADGRRVRSRALSGGRERGEAIVARMKPTELATDGTTLAVTGELPGEFDGGATGLSITRPGSGRARLRASRAYSQEYAAIRAPVVTRRGVTALFDQFAIGVSTTFVDYAAGEHGNRERATGGMRILTWAAYGSRVVLVEAPSDAGCVLGSQFPEQTAGPAPCRIVLADLSQQRVLAPRISIAERTATVLRPTVMGGSITSRSPLAGVAVVVREGARVVASLTTDAQGRVTLPENTSEQGLAVEAATTPRSYAFYAGQG